MFEPGVVVISENGTGIADYPVMPGRSGGSFAELEFFKEVVATGKPAVGKPRLGRFSSKPVIGFAVPVMGPKGKLIAALAGYTMLSDPALLGTFESLSYKDFQDRLLLVSPKYRIFITGSDPSRIMTPTPETGINPLLDRFMTGFEGSGITVNARGIRILLTAKKIPTPAWVIRVGMPTAIAFEPIHKMKIRVYSIALGLSLLSSFLVWLVIKQSILPLHAASKLIEDITAERLPLQNIPVTKHDEVGQVLASFNVHLDYRKKAEEQLRISSENLHKLAAHLQSIREEERMNIARDLHDELGQALTAMKMDLSWIQNKYKDHKLIFDRTDSMLVKLDATILSIKRICTELRPSILDDFGLMAAMEWQAKEFQERSGIVCTVIVDPLDIELDKERSIVLYRIFQEALTNVLKHAQATNVTVRLIQDDDNVMLEIMDNGKGITDEQLSKPKSFGLIGMHERVHPWGGKVEIVGTEGGGTIVRTTMPLLAQRLSVD